MNAKTWTTVLFMDKDNNDKFAKVEFQGLCERNRKWVWKSWSRAHLFAHPHGCASERQRPEDCVLQGLYAVIEYHSAYCPHCHRVSANL